MTSDEAHEFVEMLAGAWQPPLTDIQKTLWSDLAITLDAKLAFTVLMRLFKTDRFRPAPPIFKEMYKREQIDTTPIYLQPQDRTEIPHWVRGWWIARREGDLRLWPDEKPGYDQIHDAYMEAVGSKFAREHGLTSGYEWDAEVEKRGICPQDERLAYIDRARDGEGPRTAEEIASALP